MNLTGKFDKKRAAALLREYLLVFGVGAIGYSSIEILWRGRTHWTMALTGGACLDGLYAMTKREKGPMWQFCLRGSCMITAAEFAVGLIVNRRLKWNVWDYSRVPLNIMGQICPVYSFLWFLLCRPGNTICKRLDQRIHHK
ncbi:MAG TPA: hypothetical protein IAB39_09095 [Candidatus Onthovicinus excrementipullorum]|nr:hypothetical protein [Candidatus Onthovicinus excrementipullorum]